MVLKESREDKFRRISKARLKKVHQIMLQIQNLSSRRFYDYNENEINELFEAYENKGKEIYAFFCGKASLEKELDDTFVFFNKPNSENIKQIKFHELAEMRLSKCFKITNTLIHLSNKKNYSYELDIEVKELFKAYYEIGLVTRSKFQPNIIIDRLFEK